MTGRQSTLPSAGSPGEVSSCLPPVRQLEFSRAEGRALRASLSGVLGEWLTTPSLAQHPQTPREAPPKQGGGGVTPPPIAEYPAALRQAQGRLRGGTAALEGVVRSRLRCGALHGRREGSLFAREGRERQFAGMGVRLLSPPLTCTAPAVRRPPQSLQAGSTAVRQPPLESALDRPGKGC